MANKISPVPFSGTKEQEQKLLEVIAAHKDTQGALISVLQQAQDIYGYLPVEVQKHIAAELDIPYSEVFGVVTFYSQFQLNPKGAHPVAVCLGTACYVKGSGIIMEKLEEMLGIKSGAITSDLRFSLDATRCIGACGLAPVMTIGEDVYGRLEPSMLKDILAKYQD